MKKENKSIRIPLQRKARLVFADECRKFFLALAFLGLSQMNAQVGIGTTTPHPSAILEVDVSSLTDKKGFLPPRLSETEKGNITDPATGLTIYNTTINCVEFWGGFGWTDLCTPLEPGEVLISQTGKIWMDRNLGANQVATSETDADGFGDLYQWGRASDGHQEIDRSTNTAVNGVTTTLSTTDEPGNNLFITTNGNNNNDWRDGGNDDLWQGEAGINNPCPAGYRLPTEVELDIERQSWESNDIDGAYGSPLKITQAGGRNYINGNVELLDRGILWSSTIDGSQAKVLVIRNNDAFINTLPRATGRSVRCIKD